jgi:hypothetical protein
MSLKNGKHIVGEIEGVRCTIVETGITQERVNFLKDLLEHNKFEVKVMKEKAETENAIPTYTLGVTSLLFNPVIAVYDLSLLTKEGKKVSPAYWNQKTTISDSRYWIIRKYSFQKEV